MHNNSDSIKAASVGAEAGARRSRRGRPRHHKPVVREDVGKWIWIDQPEEAHNYYLYARKLFELSDKPTEAVIKAAADTRYKLYVNGNYVGKGPVRSIVGYTYYDTYDIAPHLSKGKNVIAFLAHHIGEPVNFAPLKQPGILCKAEIAVGEETVMVVSDETWTVHRADDWTDQGARLSEALGYQEVYDSAQRLEGWNEVKFKEKGWENAVVVGAIPSMPWGELVDREIPPLAEETIYPDTIALFNSPERSIQTPPADVAVIMADSELTELKSGSVKDAEAILTADGITKVSTPRSDVGVVMLLDFGREVFGNVEIGIAGSASGVIDIGYAEMLEDDRVKPDRAGMKYTDRVILKKGKLEWQGFEPRAFRYMQIEFRRCSRAVTLDHVRVNQSLHPVNRTGSFECSDELLNDIWHAAAYTTHLCMEDTFVDSPWRERAMWWGDARIQSRAAYYAFDDTAMLAQGLRQMATQQTEDGAILGMYPGSSDRMVPDYALHWVFSLLDYYAFADDAGLLRDLYPNMQRLLEWFGKHSSPEGLLKDVPGWLFIDWAELEKGGEVTALNCLYYHALRVAAMIAGILGREDDALEYMQISARLRIAINKYLYSPKKGLYADCRVDGVLMDTFSSQANILAALFDVPDHYRKASILRVLIGNSLPEINTPYFASHLVEVLCAGDRHVDALHIMRKRWGDMIKAGATTFWEFFSGEGSMCHGWSAGPARDLIAEFLGIKPVIGSHRFSVSPRMGDLKWARGSVNTKVGPLVVEWKTIRGSLTISVEVPQGVKVDVYPPCPADCKVTVDGKSQPSSFATLSGGSHTVRVMAAKPPKQAPYDKSLEPTPMPHVEILHDIMPRGRRRLGLATERRRGRTRRGEEPVVETGIIDVTELETPVELVSEVGPEVAADARGESGESGELGESGRKSRRRRSRRGGKGRSRAAETVEQAEGAVSEASEAAAEAVPVETEAVSEELAAEAPTKSRRRRSRRGGRGRSRSSETVEAVEQGDAQVEAAAEATEPVVIEQPAETSAEEVAAEEQPHKSRRRRSRRGGRGRNGRSAETVESAESIEAPEVLAEAPVAVEPVSEPENAPEEALAEAPSKPRRRRSRGGRRHRGEAARAEAAGNEPVSSEPEQQSQPLVVPEPQPEPVQVEQPAEPAPEEPKKPRRSRSRKSHKAEPAPAAPAEQPAQEAAPVQVEPKVEEKPEAPKPEPVVAEEQPKKRRPRRNGRKPAASEPAEAEESVEMPAPAPEPVAAPEPAAPAAEATEAPAPRKPRSRARKPKAAVEAVPIEQAPEPAPEQSSEPASEAVEAPEAPKKRRTYTRKPRKKPEAEPES